MNKALETLKRDILTTDNEACFIERERFLQQAANGFDETDPVAFAKLLTDMLGAVSVPVQAEDMFVGRVLEARPDEGMQAPSTLLVCDGHKDFDYAMILQKGLRACGEEIAANAARLGDTESLEFAASAKIVLRGIAQYAARYADAAEKAGKTRAAAALRRVPMEPAFDMFSALQGMWLLHMVASCYVGSRDYAFGWMDKYLYPYYQQSLKNGETEEELAEQLAFFFVKANEICGRATHNYRCKPVLSQASKQYVCFGGKTPNALSMRILDAAALLNTPQPQFTVLLDPSADEAFSCRVFEVMAAVTDKLHVYNYPQIVAYLLKKGVPQEAAESFTFSACCTFDLDHHSIRREHYVPTLQLFSKVLRERDYTSVDEILAAYQAALGAHLQSHADAVQQPLDMVYNRRTFVLDSVLMSDCIAQCRFPARGTMPYNVVNLFFSGMATVGDSLLSLDTFVFKGKRCTYADFVRLMDGDFAADKALHREILQLTKFGNDTAADDYTVKAVNAFCDAAESIKAAPDWYYVTGLYSLWQENYWAAEIPATPDGRLAGQPYSENQSPSYGADKNGLTALLNSLGKIPFARTATGGLNLTFSAAVPPAVLQQLVTAYLAMGGLHVGMTVLSRRELEDAVAHPENYPALTVRLYGFSEYFVSLPDWQQQAVLARTAY